MSDIARERAIASQKVTAEIEAIYNRTINRMMKEISAAIVEAQTHTRPSDVVETQQAYIARLHQLETIVAETSRNPLGTFNWDWA